MNNSALKDPIEELKEEEIEEIRRDPNKIRWYIICKNKKLSECFIREFSDKVYWPSISLYQKLSEDFIREFSDKLNIYNISCIQKLSEDFIYEFYDKINLEYVVRRHKLNNVPKHFKLYIAFNHRDLLKYVNE